MRGFARRATYLKLGSPMVGDEEIEELLAVIREGWVTTGPRVKEFQRRLEDYVGAPYIRCLASCTAGLTLGLKLAGVGPGTEVVLPAMTFVSCANAVEQLGGRPVLADCDPETGHIDLDHAATLIGPRTVALMPVHLGGHPLDMDAVNAFRDRHGVTVVEDAAHAIGAEWRGVRVGAHGNMAAFSFHATKNITTFEGGALVVLDEPAAERVEHLSLHGLSRSAWTRHGSFTPADYEVTEPGFKCGMSDVSAAVGIHQLTRLDAWIDRRAALADAYDESLSGLPLELQPRPEPPSRHAHHLYAVRVREDAPRTRDELIAALHEAGIGSSVHFKPLHLFAHYRERTGLRAEDLPASLDRGARTLTLPLHPAMTEADVEDVAAALGDALS